MVVLERHFSFQINELSLILLYQVHTQLTVVIGFSVQFNVICLAQYQSLKLDYRIVFENAPLRKRSSELAISYVK